MRAFMASGYFNGKIYLVGGYSTGNIDPAFLQTWEYDPVANTFVTKTSIPAPVGFGGAGSGVVNGHMYVAGGRDANDTVIATTWDYDIAADTWTARANLPAGVNVPGSAVIGGKLWIFGGGNPLAGPATTPTSANKRLGAWFNRLFHPDTTDALEIYDPVTDSWSSGPSLNLQRSFPAGTHVGNTAVAVGGYDGIDTIASVEINVPVRRIASPTPTPTGTPSPTPSCTPGGTPGPWTLAWPLIRKSSNRRPSPATAHSAILPAGIQSACQRTRFYRYDSVAKVGPISECVQPASMMRAQLTLPTRTRSMSSAASTGAALSRPSTPSL